MPGGKGDNPKRDSDNDDNRSNKLIGECPFCRGEAFITQKPVHPYIIYRSVSLGLEDE